MMKNPSEFIWPKIILMAAVSVFASVLITDVQTTEVQRDGCNRRQPIFQELKKQVDDSAKFFQSDPNPKTIKRVKSYRQGSKRINSHIIRDCNKAYPHTLRFIK